MLAAPPQPEKAVTRAWADAYASLEQELGRWESRLRRGKGPLTVGERSRLRSLIKTIETQTNLPPSVAEAAAGISRRTAVAAHESMLATRDSIPSHTLASATEASREVGAMLVPNTQALNTVVTGQVGQLTGDYTRLSRAVRDSLTRELTASVATGEGVDGLAKRIRGISDRTFRAGQARSVMIARTTLARTYDLARQPIYAEAAALGVIKGWKWVCNGANPCDVCLALSGTIFPYDEDTYRHPNCRCSTVPVLMDEKGNVGDRVGGRSGGGDPADLELVTRNGWTHWTLRKSVAA